jgi:hypothetical protein
MIDEIIINKKAYRITDQPTDLTIELVQKLDLLVPVKSYYRDDKEKPIYVEDLAAKSIAIVTGLDFEYLKQAENLKDIHEKFTHPLLYFIYRSARIDLTNSKFSMLDNLYKNESVFAFAEASDLLSSSDPIKTAEYLTAIYFRKKKEHYSEELAMSRIELFKQLNYGYFLLAMMRHNETSTHIRKYHPKIFEGEGKGKGMNALISMVAEKGVFTEKNQTALECARNVRVGKFFDYVETIV